MGKRGLGIFWSFTTFTTSLLGGNDWKILEVLGKGGGFGPFGRLVGWSFGYLRLIATLRQKDARGLEARKGRKQKHPKSEKTRRTWKNVKNRFCGFEDFRNFGIYETNLRKGRKQRENVKNVSVKNRFGPPKMHFVAKQNTKTSLSHKPLSSSDRSPRILGKRNWSCLKKTTTKRGQSTWKKNNKFDIIHIYIYILYVYTVYQKKMNTSKKDRQVPRGSEFLGSVDVGWTKLIPEM